MQTLIDLFNTFPAHGSRTVFVNRTGVRRYVVSYAQFHRQALQTAVLLKERGVRPGDRVLIWGPNSSWWAAAYWGAIAAGAVAVPVDFMSDRNRAQTIHTATRAAAAFQSRLKAERLEAPQTILLEDLQYLIEELKPLERPAPAAPGDMAQLIYTSGTTGNPKGVILTHANLIANMAQIARAVPVITADFTFLSLLPLSHMFEQMGGFFTPLYHGGAVVYLGVLKPSAIMEALAEEDVYAMMSVPRLMQMLKGSVEQGLAEKHLDRVAVWLSGKGATLSPEGRKRLFFPIHRKFGKNFAVFVSGGAPLSAEVFNFWNGMGFRLLEGYGLTECSPVLTVNLFDRQKPGSVGLPLPDVRLRIENQEIVAAGPNVFPGYYENPEATKGAFTPDGWFRSGDMGEIDPEGWLFIKGREKEMIVTGAGINVFPDEIEALLNRIAGVRESCVIGLDRGSGEEVHAVLLLGGSGRRPDGIVAEANTRLDTLHRIASVSVWEEPEFPKTTTLKIQKFVVKERLSRGRHGETDGTVNDRLINLLARITGTPATEIREDSTLVADLGLSSIARVELVSFLEQEYRLDIDEARMGPQTRVSDVRGIIQKREKVEARDHLRFWTNTPTVRSLRRIWDTMFHRPLFRLLVDLEVTGAERLDRVEGPVFFVCNHLSYFDQPSIMFALPPRLRYRTATAAWAEFFFGAFESRWTRLWRWLTYQYGTLLVNLFPLPQTRGFGRSMRFMGRLADRGLNILIFPEGQHSRSGALLPFQPGLGIMVKQVGIPVVPLKIEGTNRVLPPDSARLRPGKVRVIFGEPLRFTLEEPEEIVAITRAAVEKL